MSEQTRGFGFKIDYASAIAQDEMLIAWYERCITNGWYQREVGACLVQDLLHLVLYVPGVAAQAGLSLQDVADLAFTMDARVERDVRTLQPDLPAHRPAQEAYRNTDVISKTITSTPWLPRDEGDARTLLKQAKASLSRHKRNRERYGQCR